ncbi:MAG: UDP-N-acetylmuramoyl-L-alanine--D-glutamate ligase, partial [Burkholderiales bacterium]
MPLELENRRVLVLGLGSSGMSMARWLAGRGARVHVADSRAVPPNAEQLRTELPGVELHTGAFRPESFADAELIAISPGVPLAEPLVQAVLAR